MPAMDPVVRGRMRRWTNEELQKLLQDYSERVAGSCPVCANQVTMVVCREKGMRTLSICCGGCQNASVVVS